MAGDKKKSIISVRDITLMALMCAVTFAQELAMSYIPNISFTHLCIALTFYLLGLPKTLLVVLGYVLLDNFVMGSFNIIYVPIMIVMWCVFVILLWIFSKIFKSRRLMPAIVGFVHGLLYSWAFAVEFYIFYKVPLTSYLIADIYWEIALSLTAFITIFLCLPRLIKIINLIYKKVENNNKSSNSL